MANVIYVIAGLVLLFFSRDFLVRGIVTIANRLHLSNFFISAVVIGFGTSIPEFLVCLNAVLGGFPEIALGNVIGSNISNVLLVLGLAAIIRPIPCQSSHIRRDAVMAMAARLYFSIAFAGRFYQSFCWTCDDIEFNSLSYFYRIYRNTTKKI